MRTMLLSNLDAPTPPPTFSQYLGSGGLLHAMQCQDDGVVVLAIQRREGKSEGERDRQNERACSFFCLE